MKRFVEGLDRSQSTLFPETLEDFVAEDNPVRAVEAFVEGLDLGELGFERTDPKATGRPAYHPSVLLKLYIYGYLNRVQSSRRPEREAGRNVEVMCLSGHVTDEKQLAVDELAGLIGNYTYDFDRLRQVYRDRPAFPCPIRSKAGRRE